MSGSRALWTFQDAVEHLIDVSGGTTVAEERRKARRAVELAYCELPLRDDWGYLTRRGQFLTDASQSTGTVAYDHSGGAYERMLTLSGTTWPGNARYGTVIISNQHYLIESRKSDTIVTLRHDSNPGSDVASGTSYEYYRSIYPVPMDFRRGSEPIEFQNSGRPVCYAPPEDWLTWLAVHGRPTAWINAYTIRGVTDDYNTLAFEVAPPSTAQTFDYVYSAIPRPLQVFGSAPEYSTGTISVSGTTVTGSSTVWEERMTGCVIRFPPAGSSTIPTGSSGAYGNDNPAAEYRIVQAVASATSLTIDQAPAGSYSGVKYTIGDPLDLDYQVMLDAFLALCEWKFSIILKEEMDIRNAKEGEFNRQFRMSREQDYRRPRDGAARYPMSRYAEMFG